MSDPFAGYGSSEAFVEAVNRADENERRVAAEKRFVTPLAAAERLGLPRRTVLARLEAGELLGKREGRLMAEGDISRGIGQVADAFAGRAPADPAPPPEGPDPLDAFSAGFYAAALPGLAGARLRTCGLRGLRARRSRPGRLQRRRVRRLPRAGRAGLRAAVRRGRCSPGVASTCGAEDAPWRRRFFGCSRQVHCRSRKWRRGSAAAWRRFETRSTRCKKSGFVERSTMRPGNWHVIDTRAGAP
jgi:hypothetical protein